MFILEKKILYSQFYVTMAYKSIKGRYFALFI